MDAVSSLHKLLVGAAVALGVSVVSIPLHAQAQATAAPAAEETYAIEVKIIEARQKSGTGVPTALEPALAPLANDLNALPFEGFRLVDTIQKDLQTGEAVTLQFGNPQRRRFVRATARGKAQGKVKLDVVMERSTGKKTRSEFKSDVSIPEAGTLVLVATTKNAAKDNVVLLAISARTLTPAAAAASGASSSSAAGTPSK